ILYLLLYLPCAICFSINMFNCFKRGLLLGLDQSKFSLTHIKYRGSFSKLSTKPLFLYLPKVRVIFPAFLFVLMTPDLECVPIKDSREGISQLPKGYPVNSLSLFHIPQPFV